MDELSVDLKGYYEEYYASADQREWRRLGAVEKAANIVALCGGLSVAEVLEIGAGDGAVLERLAELGFGERRYALEVASSAVETIRKKNIPGVKDCVLFDGYHVPYPDERFDLAVLSHVIEHVEHPRQLLYEASRVARHVFVEVPLEDTLRLSEKTVFEQAGHINFYSLKTIRLLLRSSGLHVVADSVTNVSLDTYTYAKGAAGALNYLIKETFLRVSKRAATRIFCYHASFLCVRGGARERP